MEKKKIIKRLKEIKIAIEFGMPIYTDNLEVAYFANVKFTAFISKELLPEPNKFDIAVVPLIKNTYLGSLSNQAI